MEPEFWFTCSTVIQKRLPQWWHTKEWLASLFFKKKKTTLIVDGNKAYATLFAQHLHQHRAVARNPADSSGKCCDKQCCSGSGLPTVLF